MSEDGSQGLAYATNSVHSSDDASVVFRNGIQDLMDAIQDAGEWPAIDMFGKYNPEFDAWAADAFGSPVTGRAGMAEIWAPEADPDGDDRCNALEAFLGSDPTVPERPNWASASLTDPHLILRWTRKIGARGVEATPESTTSLGAWVGIEAEIINRHDLIAPLFSVIQEARVPRANLFGPGQSTRKYLRLRLTTP